MVDGWIALHRQLTDNPLWIERPFSKGQAWVDLLLLANHADKKMMLGNKMVTIKRGQRHTSELKLAERWGWSRHKTRDFLQLLVSEKMLSMEGTTQGTTITIEKYADYQDFPTTEGTAKGQQKDNERTSKGTQTTKRTMTNNDNKILKDIYGAYKNVTLSKDEMQKLINKHGEYLTNELVEFLSAYREDKGYKNKSDYLAIGRWVVDAVEKKDKKSENPFKDRLRKEIEREADTERNRIDNGDDPYRLSRILPEPK